MYKHSFVKSQIYSSGIGIQDSLMTESKIANGKHCKETGETPKETVETPGETYRNTRGNGRKQLGNRENIALRE